MAGRPVKPIVLVGAAVVVLLILKRRAAAVPAVVPVLPSSSFAAPQEDWSGAVDTAVIPDMSQVLAGSGDYTTFGDGTPFDPSGGVFY